jgi:hypothetical protein
MYEGLVYMVVFLLLHGRKKTICYSEKQYADMQKFYTNCVFQAKPGGTLPTFIGSPNDFVTFLMEQKVAGGDNIKP